MTWLILHTKNKTKQHELRNIKQQIIFDKQDEKNKTKYGTTKEF